MDKSAQEQLYKNTVKPAIIENGKECTLLRATLATNKPFEGYKPGVTTEFLGHCIELSSDADGVDESLARDAVKVVMCFFIDDTLMTEEHAVVPLADTFKMGNKTYTITKVSETKPGNVLFFYTLYLGA